MIETHDTSFSALHTHLPAEASLSQLTPGSFNSKILLTDLFSIFFKKIHPLFLVDCGVILIYDEQKTVISEVFTSTYLIDTEQISTRIGQQPSKLTTIQKNIAEFSFPVIKTMEEWIEEEGINHDAVNSISAYNYHCYIPLEINNKVLGTLELHNATRELGAECLTFCSNLADLLSDIIYLQRRQGSLTSNEELHFKKTTMQPGIENQELISLKEQIAQINNITVFELFIDRAAKLFPLAYGKLKPQLEEIKNLKTKLEDSSVHIAEDYTLPAHNYPEIVGTGLEMRKVFALIDQVANSESTVLIFGETGTGKELIARAIHNNSARRGNNMIKINCAAIPANLIESELFGHEKGAFTGATDKRIGKFELANNSTLFLDEIGELPLDLQVKLLRALQEKEIERVGGKTVIKTNVRVISATNRDLLAEVAKGRFRQDLYFRLNVFPISLPPLRERAEDLPLLASYFLAKYAGKTGKKLTGFTKSAIKQMAKYNWPGNVRELEHLIERQVLLTKQPIINKIDLPVKEKTITDNNGVTQKIKTIDENERDHIFEVLRICKGKVSGTDGAAKLLGVPATTLNSKMKRLGLGKKHF